MDGVRVLCILYDTFLFRATIQQHHLLISTAEVHELYILSTSGFKADKQLYRNRQTREMFNIQLHSYGTNPVLYKFLAVRDIYNGVHFF